MRKRDSIDGRAEFIGEKKAHKVNWNFHPFVLLQINRQKKTEKLEASESFQDFMEESEDEVESLLESLQIGRDLPETSPPSEFIARF